MQINKISIILVAEHGRFKGDPKIFGIALHFLQAWYKTVSTVKQLLLRYITLLCTSKWVISITYLSLLSFAKRSFLTTSITTTKTSPVSDTEANWVSGKRVRRKSSGLDKCAVTQLSTTGKSREEETLRFLVNFWIVGKGASRKTAVKFGNRYVNSFKVNWALIHGSKKDTATWHTVSLNLVRYITSANL